ncbi:MAG: hypothetical protein Q4Q22_09155, partial [Methanosphaera sp.]|nr:hypothetical protein [Methanosphaera sp.]
MTKTFPVFLEVIPEKSRVSINETNHVIVRLSADEDGEILGAQNEFINITVFYTDTTNQTIPASESVTNYLGEVYLDLKSDKKGVMNITAKYSGSNYVGDNGGVIYEALDDPVSGTYMVEGLPATINAEDKTDSIYKDVVIPVSVINATGDEVNEGTLTVKLNGRTVKTIDLANDEHQFTVYSEEPDVIEYTLVYEGDVYVAPDKTVKVTFVDDRKIVTIITTDKEGYVNEEITSPFEIKSDGNDVNIGNVSVYIQNETGYTHLITIDLSGDSPREVSKVYDAAKVYTLFYNY